MMVVAIGDELNYALTMFYFGRKEGKTQPGLSLPHSAELIQRQMESMVSDA